MGEVTVTRKALEDAFRLAFILAKAAGWKETYDIATDSRVLRSKDGRWGIKIPNMLEAGEK